MAIAVAPQNATSRPVPLSGPYDTARNHATITRIVTIAGITRAIQCGRSSRTSCSLSIRSLRGNGMSASYSRWSTSPNRTTSSPAVVRTTRPPRSSTSTASPSTIAPAAVVARTRVPSVAHTSR